MSNLIATAKEDKAANTALDFQVSPGYEKNYLDLQEESLNGFLDFMEPLFFRVPVKKEEDDESDGVIQYCQRLRPAPGDGYTVVIYFKELLSVQVAIIYFQNLQKTGLTDYVDAMFLAYHDIIHRIDIWSQGKEPTWSQIISQPSRCDH